MPTALSRFRSIVALLLVTACGARVGLETGRDSGVGGDDSSTSADSGGGWDGGLLPPTPPGVVRCGDVTCQPADHCCLTQQGQPATNGCASRELSLCNGTQAVQDCDKPTDCHADEICCIEPGVAGLAIGSYCETRDPATGGGCQYTYVACASDADCAVAPVQTCVAQKCRGEIIQSCGQLPSQSCPP